MRKKYIKSYYTQILPGRLYQKITGKKFLSEKHYNKPIMDIEKGNEFLYNKILEGKPFFAGRLGATELNVIENVLAIRSGVMRNIKERRVEQLFNWSGFFPKDAELVLKFADIYFESAQKTDFLGIWFSIFEDFIVNNYATDATLGYPRCLEPYYFSLPWTKALEDKKVLIVHPYDELIKEQYNKRKELFPKTEVLPEFELLTLKAVQSLAGEKTEYATWFDALDDMYSKISQIDSDIAILGCGAYGFPLAAKIKDLGKQAIHLGGATQILFGIKGKRWDNHPEISKMYNESWVKPGEKYVPKNAKNVEGGCYW